MGWASLGLLDRRGTRELFLKCIREEFPWLVDRYGMLSAKAARLRK